MDILLVALIILSGLGVGWSIGANDAANSLGTAVGSRILTLKQAVILIAVFGFLGAFLQGSHVVKTIGKGIVPMGDLDRNVALCVAMIACLATCAWVVLATHWKMPISTSHSIVGAVAGAGLAASTSIKWKVMLDIFICWVMTPIGAAVLAYFLCLFFKWFFYKVFPRRFSREALSALIILSGCYVAYTWGANDVANATGLISGSGALPVNISIVIGAAAIVLGIVTWGYKVIETIGSEITHLMPVMAFSAQLASAVNVHVYTVLGVPVSTSHSIVGAVFGVGLVKGVKMINMNIMKEIIICWLATPFVSGLISFAALKAILFFT